MNQTAHTLDAADLRLVKATQSGLPLTARPYHALAEQLGLDPEEVMARLRNMQEVGAIRRIGVVPNHYALGYKANGMTVWDVQDSQVDALGARVGALDFVSHCYQRPRARARWPYNLFAMVHAHDRAEVTRLAAEIGLILGGACRAHDILYSSRILKKTGLRLGD